MWKKVDFSTIAILFLKHEWHTRAISHFRSQHEIHHKRFVATIIDGFCRNFIAHNNMAMKRTLHEVSHFLRLMIWDRDGTSHFLSGLSGSIQLQCCDRCMCSRWSVAKIPGTLPKHAFGGVSCRKLGSISLPAQQKYWITLGQSGESAICVVFFLQIFAYIYPSLVAVIYCRWKWFGLINFQLKCSQNYWRVLRRGNCL